MSGTQKNRMLKDRIHKIDSDSVLKLQDVWVFGSNRLFSFHLRGITVILFSLKAVSRQPISEKCSLTTQPLELGFR